MRRCSVNNNNIISPCKLIFLISLIGDRVIKNVDTFFYFRIRNFWCKNKNMNHINYIYHDCLSRIYLGGYIIFFGVEVIKYTNFIPRCNAAWLMQYNMYMYVSRYSSSADNDQSWPENALPTEKKNVYQVRVRVSALASVCVCVCVCTFTYYRRLCRTRDRREIFPRRVCPYWLFRFIHASMRPRLPS